MIKAFGRALKDLKKPGLWLPAVVATAANLGIFFLVIDTIYGMLYDVMVLGLVPEGELLELPFLLLAAYPVQIATGCIAVFVMFCISLFAVFAVADYLAAGRGKRSIAASMGFAIRSMPKAFAVGVLAAAIAVILAGAALFALWLGIAVAALALVSILLLILLMLVAVYLYVKLYLLPVAMAVEKANVKAGLQKLWAWNTRRFWELLAFVCVLSVLSTSVGSIGTGLGEIAPGDILGVLVPFIFVVLAITYVNAAGARYYLGRR